ncbi:MAG: hypothetical protein J5926_02420 [Ruminococcus sp.]|nr:hypothetical protein [Ruminococcus sp.]
MRDYLVTFLVNGRRTEQTVRAQSQIDARKLIEAQYAGQRISFMGVKPL